MHYGLDIGGTKIEIAAFDARFQRDKSVRLPTPKRDYREFLHTLKATIEQFDQHYGLEGSVGLGIPGTEKRETGVFVASNIPAIDGRTFRRDLEQVVARPVAVENDARCFVLSETYGGSAEGYASVFGVILGTGAGGAICYDKRIYRGTSNLAGEWGHTPLPAVIQQKYQLPIHACGCGLRGCYERYVSGPAIANLYTHFTGHQVGTSNIIAMMRVGDVGAIKTFEAFIDIAGAAMAGLVLILNPDVFVLGGGVSNISEIYEHLPLAIEQHLFGRHPSPAVLPPVFGDSGGVRGAAILGSQ